MITNEEYNKALDIVNEYTEQVNNSLINNHKCICCKRKTIELLDDFHVPKPTEQEQACWHGGTVERISFGYGSRHDMRSFYVGICDDCITLLEASGLAIDFKLLKKEENKHFKRIINPENK